MTIIMGVAEVSARRDADLTPKDVPRTITTSVVGGSLLVIFADCGFYKMKAYGMRDNFNNGVDYPVRKGTPQIQVR